MNANKNIRLQKDDLKWFKIEKYSRAKDFTPKEWHSALIYRYMLRGMIKADTCRQKDELSKLLVGYIAGILLMPLGLLPGRKNAPRTTFSSGASLVWDRTVSDATEDWLFINTPFCDGIRDAHDRWLKDMNNADLEPQYPDQLNEPLWQFIRGVYINNDVFSVNVNVSGSNDQIIADFTEWLTGMRESTASKTPVKQATELDMRNWATYKVLAYIDLDIFCRLMHSKISQATLGEMLFPNETGVDFTERIRKVVAPMEKKLMDSSFIDAIDIQVSKAERKKQKTIPE